MFSRSVLSGEGELGGSAAGRGADGAYLESGPCASTELVLSFASGQVQSRCRERPRCWTRVLT
eukprot:4524921-Pyramimonas_sp.AAC.1